MELRGVATSLSEVRPIGDYRIDLRTDGGTTNATVTTLGGPLRIRGQGTLSGTANVICRGEARAEAAQAAALEPLLDRMGTRRPDGARAIDWRLPLR